MNEALVIYGAYGYTGRLIVEETVRRGLKPLLSGRNEAKLKAVADQHKLSYTVCDLSETDKLKGLLMNAKAVIHAAGPFMFTAHSMAKSCLATKTHYLDITGEIAVFELMAKLSAKAKEAGITLLPGAGFDVVPSDCLAAHLKSRLPDASHLELAFTSNGGMSKGTAKTVVEGLGLGGAIRRDGKISIVKNGYKAKVIDYGDFKTLSATISWGDVSTAYHSTSIPNIEVYTGVSPKILKMMRLSNYFGWLLKTPVVKNYMRKRIDRGPAGPSAKKRAKTTTYLWGKAVNDKGHSVESRLKTPDGYTLTAATAVASAIKVLDGDAREGFQTPSTAFGKDFILEFPGCERKDA